MDWSPYDAVLFDLDGVVTPTAEVHMRAWAAMFDQFLTDHPTRQEVAAPYTDADYFAYIDGRPRFEGVSSFLASRGIELPQGTEDDDPELDTVGGLGNRKNAMFSHILATEGVRPYPGSLALLEYLGAQQMPMAIVSSSRNAPAVLHAASVTSFFAEVMHGGIAAERGLPGKPAPDTFLAAAADLDTAPERAVVIEDAISGVRAGVAGGFALVIGVDRGVGTGALRAAGASEVVSDLAQLIPGLTPGPAPKRSDSKETS
ncbi:MAG: beta-phosphoglucomutase family hydrolase [Nocardioidaceae bacterium]|nr:MAG: beta-phosphoglucomutase family hydrolase [Nocardioidaceae bacterium]